ncbi:MAG: phage distal tail protein [Clostridium chrysemydis]|uniref:phage distal tail protein n=1 Tax=Clostridium chrysemydis TaxID=2665504 RepID=UPI003F35EE5D
MFINNIDIGNFHGRVLNISIQNSQLSNKEESDIISEIETNSKNNRVGLNVIEVELLIDSRDKHLYYIDRSNLLNLMLTPFVIYFEDRNLKFKCKLMNHSNLAGTKQIRGRYKLTMYGINQCDEVIENLNRVNQKTINVKGNSTINCIIEIIPSIDLIDLVIGGLSDDPIIIKNLHSNKKIIINGETGTVLEEGVNKFNDTDFWEFPFLIPGTNRITFSKNSCNVTIKYKPRYI